MNTIVQKQYGITFDTEIEKEIEILSLDDSTINIIRIDPEEYEFGQDIRNM